jgi:hypothetical protein
MGKKQLTLLFGLVLIFPLATAAFAQQTAATPKPARWEGRVERGDKEHSTLIVRKASSNVARTVVYGSSTVWVSEYHADKKAKEIDPSQVKDGDYVICVGTWDKGGVINATLISKRLSHSQ